MHKIACCEQFLSNFAVENLRLKIVSIDYGFISMAERPLYDY